MRKLLLATMVGTVAAVTGAGPVLACGGIFSRNGEVNLVRTTTMAAYHEGVEHYVTAFEFAGSGGAFGSIVPLPGVPTAVEKGGEWTLQRLAREVEPPFEGRTVAVAASAAAGDAAEVLLETRIDALDLTVLRGGGAAVGEWAAANGFTLTPDAPEVLDFYARRSPVFLAARFDADAARRGGVALGDGTPVHLTIPTDNPWVPLRILALGRKARERVNADVFLLTDRRPTLLPGGDADGMRLDRQERASDGLLDDLRSDRGMGWMPESMWLSHIRVDAAPAELTYDLAVDASGEGRPSALAAGLETGGGPTGDAGGPGGDEGPPFGVLPAIAVAGAGVLAAGAAVAGRRRPA